MYSGRKISRLPNLLPNGNLSNRRIHDALQKGDGVWLKPNVHPLDSSCPRFLLASTSKPSPAAGGQKDSPPVLMPRVSFSS